MSTAVADLLKADKSTNSDQGSAVISQLVSFRLSNEEYGVDIMKVQEIILPGAITLMPQVPAFIRGLINLRGHVIPIIDLRRRFSLPAAQDTEETRIIVVNITGRTIGMVVDAVNEVLRISSEQIEPPPSSVSGIEQEYIMGLVKFDKKLLIMLNVDLLLTEDEKGMLVRESGKSAEPQ
jgi:purine-binding chemotaxis protein CheW